MKPVYEIKFLSNEDFDKLPKSETNGSDITDSLGFYNPFTNRVFIRHTEIPSLNKYLLDHEFEHLLEEHPTDADENGIRHKKKKRGFLDWFTGLSTAGLWHPNEMATASANKESDKQMAQQKEQEQMLSSFGGLGMGLPGSGETSPTFGTSQSPLGGQQSTQSGLNQGLNSQSINPLEDPYAKYGQQSGRILNF